MVVFVNAYSLSYYMFSTYKEIETAFKLDRLIVFYRFWQLAELTSNFLIKYYKQLGELMWYSITSD